VVVED
jgi:ribonuclease HI